MKKNYVTFMSPGTMVAEQKTVEIERWDTKKAIAMARDIKERHGATPYGFYFTKRERGGDDFDSKETDRSNLFYLGGVTITLDELERRNDPEDRVLISNMRCNNWDSVIENNNSWKWTQPLRDDDVVLDFKN